jgi:peptide/nickel transport system permease protein
MCAPSFAVAIFLLYLFAVELGWFPAFGPGEGFTNRLWHLTLPAVAIMMGGAAYVIMYTRTAVASALQQDYVTFARARGLSRRRVLFAHALRNALIPIVTTGGATLAYLLVGAVIVETAFALPGLGTLLLDSVRREDIPVVQALSLLIATVVIGANLLTDIVYTLVDPRIRYGKGAQ